MIGLDLAAGFTLLAIQDSGVIGPVLQDEAKDSTQPHGFVAFSEYYT